MADEIEPERRLRAGLVLPVRADRTGGGGPTPAQVRGPGWRRTSRGLYVPRSVSTDDVEQRIVEASAVVPPGFAITGWAALRWQGARWFSGVTGAGARLPITIVIGTHDIRPQPRFAIAVSGEGLNPGLVHWVEGVPVTDPRYSLSFEMRYATHRDPAVTAFAMAAYADLVSYEEMAEFLDRQNGWTGIPQARDALPLVEENLWSPQECGLVKVWAEAGFRRPLCNRPVFDLRGRHIGTPDVFDPVAGIGGEYDGSLHLARRQRDLDLRREGLFREHLIDIVTMTASDRYDPSAFVRRLRTAYRHAHLRRADRRAWTIEQPEWWVPTETVEQRRALSPEQRRRFLRHRSA